MYNYFLSFAATEESQRGNDCGVGLLCLVVKTFSDHNFFFFFFACTKKKQKSAPGNPDFYRDNPLPGSTPVNFCAKC